MTTPTDAQRDTDAAWWRFLLGRKSPDVSWWAAVRCRASGHKCGPVYYAPSATEPDWHCNCSVTIGGISQPAFGRGRCSPRTIPSKRSATTVKSPEPDKPLGIKAYGSIPHLPGSRLGPGDHHVSEGQAAIATVKARDKHDRIILTEKLDGSCTAVARINGELVALGRAGHRAQSSKYEQHQMFAAWVRQNWQRFDRLREGERIVGEWLAQAHGTRYSIRGRQPWAVFDMLRGFQRLPWTYTKQCVEVTGLQLVPILHEGGPISIEAGLEALDGYGYYGALDRVEGLVWRVEARGLCDFMAKYVRPDKVDGCYLPELSGQAPIWNWQMSTIQPGISQP